VTDKAKIMRVIKSIHELVGWVKRSAVSMVVALGNFAKNQISPKYRLFIIG